MPSAAGGGAAWLVERGTGAGRLPVHLRTGDCWDTGKRCVPAGAEQVRRSWPTACRPASTAARTPPSECSNDRVPAR
ncbi:DUF6233 domain-containing protein [Streptomyces sp. NPDC048340]|uniref:DUF6233 domain-containing protein n=1 Tax=Streptomyces sp. NPDC048340 TaxID=3365537 RepID=UPI0037150E8C